jgi:hypothetical protein
MLLREQIRAIFINEHIQPHNLPRFSPYLHFPAKGPFCFKRLYLGGLSYRHLASESGGGDQRCPHYTMEYDMVDMEEPTGPQVTVREVCSIHFNR